MQGVVVVEELERARVVLERSDVGPELKVDTLENLLRKNPAKEVLIKTRLGMSMKFQYTFIPCWCFVSPNYLP